MVEIFKMSDILVEFCNRFLVMLVTGLGAGFIEFYVFLRTEGKFLIPNYLLLWIAWIGIGVGVARELPSGPRISQPPAIADVLTDVAVSEVKRSRSEFSTILFLRADEIRLRIKSQQLVRWSWTKIAVSVSIRIWEKIILVCGAWLFLTWRSRHRLFLVWKGRRALFDQI